MPRLLAKIFILYHGRIYEPGEALPTQEGRMVEAWVEAGSAEFEQLPAAPEPPAEPELPAEPEPPAEPSVQKEKAKQGRGSARR